MQNKQYGDNNPQYLCKSGMKVVIGQNRGFQAEINTPTANFRDIVGAAAFVQYIRYTEGAAACER